MERGKGTQNKGDKGEGKGMIKSFLLGAGGYPLLEILYRGRTHPAMGLAGGLGLIALNRINRGRRSLPGRVIRGACAITAIEYITGLIFNRRHRIWDYRGARGHIQGQVCPRFFLVWMGLAAAYTFLSRKNML